MEWFNCTGPEELLIYALIISIGLSKNLTEDEMNALGNFYINRPKYASNSRSNGFK